jgi:para-nitrobenzyl esterase
MAIDDTFEPGLLVVETRQGRVRGDHRRGAYRYRGIPYAAPPTGARRFAPPAPAGGWAGIREATGKFPVAPQPADRVSELLGVGVPPTHSEADCLTLNVWTPTPDDAGRPVLVWIHGGAFVTGSGGIPWYDGANLTHRDVVVVTVNYRLGILGFLHLADLGGEAFAGSGNVGVLDQAAALSWVHDNIAAFGGDPGNVTIFGESAGGMSVATHLGLPASKGLFHRAIAQSGAASNVSSADRATDLADKILSELGLDRSEIDRLRSVPVDALIEVQEKLSASYGLVNGLPFQPVHDGDTLPSAPLDAVAAGSADGVDLIAGSNRDEMRIFVAMAPALQAADDDVIRRRLRGLVGERADAILAAYRDLHPDATATELFEVIGTDAIFRVPARQLASAQAPHGPSRVYEFHFASTSMGGMMGATHAVEVPFVFDNLDAPGAAFLTGEPDEVSRGLATTMADAWCAFARRGNPVAPSLPEWPTWERPGHPTLVVDAAAKVVDDPAAAVRDAWSLAS